VPAVALIEPLRFKMRAERRFDDFTGKDVFDEAGLDPRFLGGVLSIDLRDFFP
jgi:hypothetical protein